MTSPVAHRQPVHDDELADFSTNRRVLLLSALALVVGAVSALIAYILIWLIAAITNFAFYHRFSAAPAIPQGHQQGYAPSIAAVYSPRRAARLQRAR